MMVLESAPAKAPSLDIASDEQQQSIYDYWSRMHRIWILTVVSFSQFLNPLSSSVILPSLKMMQSQFQASNVATAAIIACYYFPVGVSSLFWGPACDMWGRKTIYLASTALYAASTCGCIWPTSIHMLLAFRAMQGLALGAYRSAGIGAIADVYHPNQRGLAIGIVLVSTLVGPVIGPILGGLLAQAFGWRAPFFLLLAFALVNLLVVMVLMRETLQYRVLQRLMQDNPAAAQQVVEADQIWSHKPRFASPWAPLVLIADKHIVLHLLVSLVGFAALISSQTELPTQLSEKYHLSPALIGVSMLPTGIAGIIFAPLGGKLFDRAAGSTPACHPMVRLALNNWMSLVGMPAGLLIWGWAAHFAAPIVVVFVGLFCVGGAMCVYLPAVMSYLTCMRQHQASTAAAGQNALAFVSSGVLILCGSAIASSVGIGWYCSILAVLHVSVAAAAQVQISRVRRAAGAVAGPVASNNAL